MEGCYGREQEQTSIAHEAKLICSGVRPAVIPTVTSIGPPSCRSTSTARMPPRKPSSAPMSSARSVIFSPAEKGAFLEAYGRAHPRRAARFAGVPWERTVTLRLPDLGSQTRLAGAFLPYFPNSRYFQHHFCLSVVFGEPSEARRVLLAARRTRGQHRRAWQPRDQALSQNCPTLCDPKKRP